MCRQFAYSGSSPAELGRLFEALKGAARNDTIAAKFTARNVHGDGWGYAIHAGGRTLIYKSQLSIFEDTVGLPDFGGCGRITAIFHARKVVFEPIRNLVSHPQHIETPSSEFMTCWNGSALRSGRRIVYGANIFVLKVDKASGDADIRYLSRFNTRNPGKQEYYRMYRKELEHGVAVISSTMALQEGIGGEPVPQCRSLVRI